MSNESIALVLLLSWCAFPWKAQLIGCLWSKLRDYSTPDSPPPCFTPPPLQSSPPLLDLDDSKGAAVKVPPGYRIVPEDWLSAAKSSTQQPSPPAGPLTSWETSFTLPAEIREGLTRGRVTAWLEAGTPLDPSRGSSTSTGLSGGPTPTTQAVGETQTYGPTPLKTSESEDVSSSTTSEAAETAGPAGP